MIKVLLEKQFAEMFRNYTYDAKKNKKRSKLSIAVLFGLFILLMVGVLGGSFTFLSIYMAPKLYSIGLGWFFFAIMGLVSILLGAFGSIFNTYSGLYLSKDNDLLLSMPIPVPAIMTSRLLGVYLMGLIYSACVSLPATVVYLCLCAFSFSNLICCILYIFLISIIDLELSCLLGWVVAKISQRLKNKSFITVILSVFFFGIYYYFCFNSSAIIDSLMANVTQYGSNLKVRAYPIYMLGRVGAGDWLSVFISFSFFGLIFAVMWYVLSKSFIGIATSHYDARLKTKKTSFSSSGVSSTLFLKELSRFTSSANYMLNCGIGTLFLVIATGAVLIKGTSLIPTIELMFSGIVDFNNTLAVFVSSGICLISSMNYMVVPSISLEGKNLWILQSMPVDSWQVLKAKLKVQLVITGVPSLLLVVCCGVVFRIQFVSLVIAIVLIAFSLLFQALFGLLIGIKTANFTWTNELVPIKQNFGSFLAMLVGWVHALLIGALIFLLNNMLHFSIGEVPYMCLLSLLTLSACYALRTWLKNKGSKVVLL